MSNSNPRGNPHHHHYYSHHHPPHSPAAPSGPDYPHSLANRLHFFAPRIDYSHLYYDDPDLSWCPIAELHPSQHFHPDPDPPPSPSNFLDTILNPPATSDSLPFGYQRVSSPDSGQPLPSEPNSMPPANTRNRRPARLPNGYVDLTAASDSPPDPVPVPAQRKRRESPTPGPSSKRQKREDGSAQVRNESKTPEKVEEIDLSTDKTPVQDILQKQQEEAVKAQQTPEEKATTFNSFTCVICMDTPTDLTATACGHLFCHTCLMEALIAGENRTGPHEPKRSQCPVCRKFINRSKATDIIPLLLKKGLATQPRKSSTAIATAAPKA